MTTISKATVSIVKTQTTAITTAKEEEQAKTESTTTQTTVSTGNTLAASSAKTLTLDDMDALLVCRGIQIEKPKTVNTGDTRVAATKSESELQEKINSLGYDVSEIKNRKHCMF